MASKGNKKAKPTAADKQGSERLRKIWEAYKRAHPEATVDWLAEQYGATQGAMSQYLNGDSPLRARAVLKLAKILGCSALEIRDDLPELHTAALAPAPPQDAIARELWSLWKHLDENTRKYLLQTAHDRLKLERKESVPFPNAPHAAPENKHRNR